jgi:hypothetical protein
MLANNTGKAYNGFRPALDMTNSILEPKVLFNAYKARVIADGGYIPDEAGCLGRFDFLMGSGMYEHAVTCSVPAYGLKVDANGDVQTVYSLISQAADLIAVQQGVGDTIKYDAATQSVSVRVTSGGGWYLKSRENLRIQKGRTYMIAGRLSDSYNADNLGLTVGISLSNLPLAYLRTMITNGQATTESWRYGSRDSAWTGSAAGGAVNAATTTYADYVPSAGLFRVDQGVISGYTRGRLEKEGQAVTGKLADLVSFTAPIIVGAAMAGGTVGACFGTMKDIIFLHTAEEADAVQASRLGM